MMRSDVGFESLLWFMGVVEDNQDPTNNGRVRVRCFGIHPPVADGEVPTEALPWASCVNGTYGKFVTIPDVAEWVFGFFADGKEGQHPMILGTIPGVNTSLPSSSGHPAAHPYVADSTQAVANFGNPPVPPQISGEDLDHTPVVTAAASVEAGETPDGQGFTAPVPSVGGDRGRNGVWSASYEGSYVELNGTDNSQHITVMHSSGSYVFLDSAGNITISSTGDIYQDSSGHNNERVAGRKNLSISGDFMVNVIDGSTTIQSKGDINMITNNDFNFNVGGKITMNAGEAIIMSGASIAMHARTDNFNLYAENALKIYSSEGNLNMASGKEVRIGAAEAMSLKSATTIGLKADESIGLEGADSIMLTTGGAFDVQMATGNLKSDGFFKASGSTVHMKAGLGVYASGSTVYIKGNNVKIDDIISMANGEAAEASEAAPDINIIANPAYPVATPDLGEPVSRAAFGAQAPVTTSTNAGGIGSSDDGGSAARPSAPSNPSLSGAGNASTAAPPNVVAIQELQNDPEWRAQMDIMLAKYPNLTEDDFYRIIQGESGFDSTIVAASGATGFFQFMPATAAELGYTTAEIQAMTPAQQLAVYDQYLERWNFGSGAASGLGIMQAAPTYANRPPNYEVYPRGSAAWNQNPGWRGSDGRITVASINAYYSNQRIG